MSEHKTVQTKDVELTCDKHTHNRVDYSEKDILRLTEAQANQLIGLDRAKEAQKGATPKNVDKEGKLI